MLFFLWVSWRRSASKIAYVWSINKPYSIYIYTYLYTYYIHISIDMFYTHLIYIYIYLYISIYVFSTCSINHHEENSTFGEVSQAAREMIIYWAKQARKRVKRRRSTACTGGGMGVSAVAFNRALNGIITYVYIRDRYRYNYIYSITFMFQEVFHPIYGCYWDEII